MHRTGSLRRATAVLATASLLVLGVVVLPGHSSAETAPPTSANEGAASGVASTDCSTSLAGGAGVAAFQSCVSSHGNITAFNAAGAEQIRVANIVEGYQLCDLTSGAVYNDFGSAESGWGAPVISQPNGTNTLPLSITRRTVDGRWELVQTYGFSSAERKVAITMKAINRSGGSRAAHLQRFVDVDADNDFEDDLAGKTLNSVWIHDQAVNGQGVMLTSGTPQQARSTSMNVFTGNPTTCTPASEPHPSTTVTDWSGSLTHSLGTLANGGSKTIKVRYELV